MQQPSQANRVANSTEMGASMITFRSDTSLLHILPIVLAAAACAPSARSGQPPAPLERPWAQSTRQIIAAPEIAEARALTAYDVIVRLRPEFLRNASRDASRPSSDPVVYINSLPAGGISTLRQISADMIVEVRYVLPRDAVTHHGEASRGGEIMIYTYGSKAGQPR